MRNLRLAMAQINTTVGDLEGNTAKVLECIRRARAQQADLVVFPEMAIPGYPPEDLLFKPSFIRSNIEKMHEVVANSQGITVVVGFVDSQGDIYNAAAVAHDGQLVGVYHKMYLPNYGVFDEDRYFKAGSECPVFVINGIHIGVNICEDIWYALGPAAVQREAGAEIIININGSPYHAGKLGFRERMVATRASDNEVYVSYTNLVGGQDELVFDGGSVVFDQGGELVARGKQLEEDLVVVDLDMDAVFRHRLHDPRPRKELPILSAIGSSQVVHVSEHTPAEPKTALDGCIAKPLDPLAGDILRPGAGDRGLRSQERFQEGRDRPLRRDRLQPDGSHRGGRPGQRERPLRRNAVPLLLRGQHFGRPSANQEPGHRADDRTHRRGL